jgi:hypothetical protein
MTERADPASLEIAPDSAALRATGNWRVVELGMAWLTALLQARTSPAPASGAEQSAASARMAYDAERDRLRRDGLPVAFDRLSAMFGLSPFEEDICLLAMAARVDETVAALFGSRGGGPSHPPLHLALRLFSGMRGEAALAAHLCFGPAAPLRRFGLLMVDEPGGIDSLSPLVLEESVARFLMGDASLDPRVAACLTPLPPVPTSAAQQQAAQALGRRIRSVDAMELRGPAGSGRRSIAAQAMAQLGLPLFELRPPRPDADPATLRQTMIALSRSARLHGFAVLVDAARVRRLAAPDNREAANEATAALVAALDCTCVLIEEEARETSAGLLAIEVTPLCDRDRLEVWREVAPGADETLLGEVAAQFPLAPEEIAQVAAAVPSFARGPLWAACRERARGVTDELGDRVSPHYGWDDIVLPDDTLNDLKAIAGQARHRAKVYGSWGFGDRLVRNTGVTALFAGPSGVGKTMAAEVICRDLDLDLLRIDLSGVVSKYIGETEKNLKRVFDAAERTGAVLFFDEADALFGKRSEVKDSHDRYANIEVSYLLQRMESYGGLAILATNMKTHLDPAFLRRLRYVVDLPFPDSASRRRIWQRAFPPEAPTVGLDFEALARLDVPGGNIVVIAVNAAFLAAGEGLPIGMVHVARAARSEFRKLDREFRMPNPTEVRRGP